MTSFAVQLMRFTRLNIPWEPSRHKLQWKPMGRLNFRPSISIYTGLGNYWSIFFISRTSRTNATFAANRFPLRAIYGRTCMSTPGLGPLNATFAPEDSPNTRTWRITCSFIQVSWFRLACLCKYWRKIAHQGPSRLEIYAANLVFKIWRY